MTTTDPTTTPDDPRVEPLARVLDPVVFSVDPAKMGEADRVYRLRQDVVRDTARRALAWFDTQLRAVTAEEVDAELPDPCCRLALQRLDDRAGRVEAGE